MDAEGLGFRVHTGLRARVDIKQEPFVHQTVALTSRRSTEWFQIGCSCQKEVCHVKEKCSVRLSQRHGDAARIEHANAKKHFAHKK